MIEERQEWRIAIGTEDASESPRLLQWCITDRELAIAQALRVRKANPSCVIRLYRYDITTVREEEQC